MVTCSATSPWLHFHLAYPVPSAPASHTGPWLRLELLAVFIQVLALASSSWTDSALGIHGAVPSQCVPWSLLGCHLYEPVPYLTVQNSHLCLVMSVTCSSHLALCDGLLSFSHLHLPLYNLQAFGGKRSCFLCYSIALHHKCSVNNVLSGLNGWMRKRDRKKGKSIVGTQDSLREGWKTKKAQVGLSWVKWRQ